MSESLKSKIWLSSPHMSGNELSYVVEAFRCNWIAPAGPHIEAFERGLCVYNEVNHAAVLSSGTAAIHLGLSILDVQPDDYVLTQSLTFVASANPIRYLGATPVFIDSEASTWNMSPYHLERAIQACLKGDIKTSSGKGSPKLPKAIVPVHLFGMPANMTEIMKIANRYGIPVLEDAAEALGSKYYGQACGAIAELGAISFNGNKIITTSSGGALMGNDEAMIQRARFLSTQAKEAEVHYEHKQMGYNYRMSNVLAGIGIAQLDVLDERVDARRKNFEFYKDYFSHIEGVDVVNEPDSNYFSNRWLTSVLVSPEETGGLTKDDIMAALALENIESRPVWKPMHLQPLYAHYSYFGEGVSNDIFNRGLCLPSGSNLSEEDLLRICTAMDEVFYVGKKDEQKMATVYL